MNIRTGTTFALLATLAGSALAQVNVAAAVNGGVATQSSDWSAIATADRANDGVREGDYYQPTSIAHTNSEAGAWWEADFAGASAIDSVNVFNRTDGLSQRINDFNVYLYLGDEIVYSATDVTFDEEITGAQLSGMTFATGGVVADRVRIQLSGFNYLQLAEVEAYSAVPEPASMVALGLGALALLRRRRSQ
ncbi:PEP-CTERM sorting domain-containing protein [bacterium]|nr:MAG: PEP-CTERM sorting domain-containing protein [bacterium]